jgi:sugar phosphate isomerase/epimerase
MSEENEVAERPDLDRLTSIYLKIRDKRSELKREFENQDKDLEEQQKMLAEQMLESCKELGADSIKTPHGTIIRSVKSKYWTGDWDSMYRFIKEHDAFGLLEKRLHQTNMKDFLHENPDVMPMGLNVENEYTIVVRRAK